MGSMDGLDRCGKSRLHWDSIPRPFSPSESLYLRSCPDLLSCNVELSKTFKAEIKYAISYLASRIFFLIRHIVFAAFEDAVA